MTKYVLIFAVLFFESSLLWAFSIGTYNLHNISNPVALKEDLNNLDHISTFVFQEVRFKNKEDNSILESILPAAYTYKVTRIVAIDDNGGLEGHAIVSKYPINRSAVISLNHSGPKNREALVAWIQVDDQEIMVIDTDHEVQYKSISYLDRKKQIESIFLSLASYDFKGPQVVLGDFNTADSIANWSLGISGAGEVKLTNELFQSHGWIPTYSSTANDYTFKAWGVTQHLDHIFLKNINKQKNYLWERYENRKGSDHYPIFIDFN
jgi:endonuclease/exonuclease/phosphatase family metal-dependent hydrolase